MKLKRDLTSAGVLPCIKKMLPGEPMREQSLAAKSRDAGLPPSVVWNRIDHGWSEDRALSIAKGVKTRNHPNCLAAKARAAGLPPDMVRRRVREGWSEERALEVRPLPNGNIKTQKT
jgi:hypothetical protein